ncbi:hypothetical protein [Roseibium sp. RKSG952]|uniref:hypothetical protein n=1 Tax=Roseibium sp. RKSG952 TaxID=2529384 RepID=UPI0012BB9328|nr:hypothetical protein [Roseibium sp. RKSG952]MTH95117.1 hypothetical protein [Roseibium sp. RKSG952]
MARFTVPTSDLHRIKKRLQTATNKARLAGLPVPTYSILRDYCETYLVPDGFARLRGQEGATRAVGVSLSEIEIDPGDPTFLNYRITGGKLRYRRATGETRVAQWGTASKDMKPGIHCDHCRKKRNRARSYFIESDHGDSLEVGSTCLEEFFGRNAAAFVDGLESLSSILREAKEASYTSFRDLKPENVEAETNLVLAVAHRIICDQGFVSSGEAGWSGGIPTWRLVAAAIEVSSRPNGEVLDSQLPLLTDFMVAESVLEYLAENDTDFKRSAALSAKRGFCGPKEVAVLTAAVGTYLNSLERKERLGAQSSAADASRHVGRVGDKIEFVGEVTGTRTFHTKWGESRFVNMVDEDGNALVWKTSSDPNICEGNLYEISGTVKEHGRVDGGPLEGARLTSLIRVRFEKDLGPRPSEPSFGSSYGEEIDDEDLEALSAAFPVEKMF